MVAATRWKRLRGEWAVLTYYQRFESVATFVLTLLIGLIILVALHRLTVSVVAGLLFGVLGVSYWLIRERDGRLAGAGAH